jgi:hypothetical protein
MIAEPSLRLLWANWTSTQLARHHDTDSAPMLEIVRFAVDGAWLVYLDEKAPRTGLNTLRDRLLKLTRMESLAGPQHGDPR